ncbi:hypothetical protein FAZ19_22935 [Sphingobacterium alkalisoli]|uniref:Uncharacterized protein n=1 Tax=Sphingobacterium alkalisoli TaxID=1874115 RepID=A0A4U0GMP1_9SPHI|nr:hypothetical protein [Sphingobacterium alkalisoli]TJY60111.1 hypothetical protein FAZ19_22935 [Sphingobacterium alkalisoli]GGH31978.1 hypothetical protein GCM10011418_45180 [Sphingobacterium alkalisoli]
MNTRKTSAITSKPGLVIALILAYEDYLRQMEGVAGVDPDDRSSEGSRSEEDDDRSESNAEDVVPDTEDPNEAADEVAE